MIKKTPQPPEELFHYCPIESFYGIISNQNIWLSNSNYSNDPNENMLANEILIEISKNSKDKNIESFAAKVLNDEISILDDQVSFIFCMSKMNDDLNQWRIYGDNGYGIVLSVRTKYFLENELWTILDDKNILPKFDKIYLSNCIYEEKEHVDIIKKLLFIFGIMEGKDDLKVTQFKLYLKFYSSFFKHISYKDEQEWRVVCLPVTSPQQHVTVKYKMHFRPGRGLIIPYIKQDYIKHSSFENTPFESVKVGSNVLNSVSEIMSFVQFMDGDYLGSMGRSKLKIQEIP